MKGESAEGKTVRLRTVVFHSLVDSGHVRGRARAKDMARDLEIEMIFRGAKVEREAASAPGTDCEIRRLRAVVLRALVDTRQTTHAQAVAMADDVAAEMFRRGASIEFEAMAG